MRFTGSISRGKTAEKHNTRECYGDDEHTPENIDRARSGDNVVLVNRSLEDVYRERFGDATGKYNAKQVEKRHPERQIRDYLEHVRNDKKLQPMYEFVVQVGNKDEHPGGEKARQIYRDWMDEFSFRFGSQFAIKQAIVHMDEAVPHMHLEVVPCAESKRGLAVQNSMNKAVKQAGFEDYKAMLAGWDELLTEVMQEHGIERVAGDREKQMGGVDIATYKRSKAVERETAAAEERLEGLRQRADAEAVAVAEIDREIEQAELQSAQETVAGSLRTLWTARGDGEREEVLTGEVGGLRSRISELERANQAARERVAELDRELPGLRERYRSLGERFDVVRQRVMAAMECLREVPNIVSECAQDIARELGKRVYDPRSLDHMAKQAAAAARAASRGWQPHDRGISR